MQNFQRSGHPAFHCTSTLERGQLRNKGGGRTTIHFTASDDNVQLLLKMVITVNQLSLNGAVADLIQELSVDERASGKPVALDQMEQEILSQPLLAEVQANEELQGNLLQNYERRFENISQDQKLSKLCSEASLNLIEVGQFFYAPPSPNGDKTQSLCREHTLPRDEKENCAKGWIESDARFGPVSDMKFAKHTEDTALKLKFLLYSKIKPLLGLEL